MKALFPPLCDKNELPRRVLCFAPHADDEVFGCGALLAFHAARGDAVRVIILTDGTAGDPEHHEDSIAEVRRQESVEAGRLLGVEDHRFLGLPDGALAAQADLVARVLAECEEFEPELVYGPSPHEMHPNHRATSHAVLAACARGPARRLHLYGVNAQVQANAVYDTTPEWATKRAAIECFASQLRYHDLVQKAEAWDKARTVNIELPEVQFVEGFAAFEVGPETRDVLRRYEGAAADLVGALWGNDHGLEPIGRTAHDDPWAATAVISTWNKAEVVAANLDSLRAQTRPFASIVVVDNASTDGTAELIASQYPEVRLVVMPNSDYGACETFNIGFASATTPLVAILDDDIELPPEWLEKTTQRMREEPDSTAIVSTKIVEPGMPESFKDAPEVNRERYMSTFRGCGSLARKAAIEEAGYYDERLFIYGNERDLTCRLLNLGYRVLQYPEVQTFHKTPFGIQMGKRSLYFHARNAWLSMLKYAPLGDLLRMPWLVITKVLMRGKGNEEEGTVTDATGTIGIGKSLRQTPGAFRILLKAAGSILYNLPYCVRHRRPVRSDDFELPLH